MADIVNLREARKRRARAEARAAGDATAARHGRPKAERERTAKLSALDARRLDAHRLDAPPANADRRETGPDDAAPDPAGDA